MKVLETGATGFIGPVLAAQLVSERNELTALVRKTSDTNILPRGVKLVEGDMLDEPSLEYAVKGKDAVVHLAANFDFYPKDVKLLYRVNVGGTRSLLNACVHAGVRRFVYCSTTEVIGPVKDPPADEETELRPQYHYSKSKKIVEDLVRDTTESSGMEHVIVRPTGIVGPGDTYVGFQTMKAINDGTIPVIPGSGLKHVSFMHVNDVVRGLTLALTTKSGVNGTFILCPERPLSYIETFWVIADQLGAKAPRLRIPGIAAKIMIGLLGLVKGSGKSGFLWHSKSVQAMLEDRWYTNEKAKKLLGWIPQMSMEEAVRKSIDSQIAAGHLTKNKKTSLMNLFHG
jgi:nucleoside-diphosphate-sugar epimerase